MKTIEILAPAKINLFLKILNKRKDGYHDIETVFEKISLFDKIVIKELPKDGIVIKSNAKAINSLGRENIIYKAARLLKRRFKINKGIQVFLEKNIPVAAGLGGGSSDAAFILKGLNKLWNIGLSNKDLLNISKDIGSDVALFLVKGSFLLGRERGNKIYNIEGSNNIKLWHVLVIPHFGISTVYAYSLFDRYLLRENKEDRGLNFSGKLRLTIPNYSANIITYSLSNRDVSLLNYYSYNSFESVIFRRFPNLGKLKRRLEAVSGDFFHLSGSGPSLFTTVSSGKEAEHLVRKITQAVSCRCGVVSTYLK